jgi:hypothetical protein
MEILLHGLQPQSGESGSVNLSCRTRGGRLSAAKLTINIVSDDGRIIISRISVASRHYASRNLQ